MAEFEICCCHEAGHAVADEEIGRHVEWIECEGGSGETRSTDCEADGEVARCYKRLVSLHAGVWAEVNCNDSAQGEECHHDWQHIRNVTGALAQLQDKEAAARHSTKAMTWVSANMPKCVPAIKGIADALIDQARASGAEVARLTGDEIRQIIAASRD